MARTTKTNEVEDVVDVVETPQKVNRRICRFGVDIIGGYIPFYACTHPEIAVETPWKRDPDCASCDKFECREQYRHMTKEDEQRDRISVGN
jgi:hypothetical protein